jgi:hypothetical protein
MAKKDETAWTLRRLKEVYSYDPETGVFERKEKQRGGSVGGSGKPGANTKNGYRLLSIDSKHYLAHRLAWAYVHGEWPKDAVSHVNGNGLDNRIANLRYKFNRGPITQERLKELLKYDIETGKFTWLVRSTRADVGQEAGVIMGEGYRTISVDGQKKLAHRLAWLYVHGTWPKGQIDHINGVRSDNRLANLRDVTSSQNLHNVQQPRSTNKTGYRGISIWKGRKFLARITVKNRIIHLGIFDTAEAAYAARQAAEKKHGILQ